MMPAPRTILEWAIWNWPAIYAPADKPETEVPPGSAPRFGKAALSDLQEAISRAAANSVATPIQDLLRGFMLHALRCRCARSRNSGHRYFNRMVTRSARPFASITDSLWKPRPDAGSAASRLAGSDSSGTP